VRRRGLLMFARSDGRLTGMPVLAMLYPSMSLARNYDPLVIAQGLKQNGPWPALTEVVQRVRGGIAEELKALTRGQVRPGQEDPLLAADARLRGCGWPPGNHG
jgi:hypothetical protein